jgi:hypothetical protein
MANPEGEIARYAIGIALTLPFNLPFRKNCRYEVRIYGQACSIAFVASANMDDALMESKSKMIRFANVRIAFPGVAFNPSEDEFKVVDEDAVRDFSSFIEDFGETDFEYVKSRASVKIAGTEIASIEGQEVSKVYGIGMQYLVYLLAICRDVTKFFFIPYVSDEFLSSGDFFMARILYYFPEMKEIVQYTDTLMFFNAQPTISNEQEGEICRRLERREGVPVVDELLLLANEDYRRGAFNPAIVEFQAAFEGRVKSEVKKYYEAIGPPKYTDEKIFNILNGQPIKNILLDHYVKCFPDCFNERFQEVYDEWEQAYGTRKMIVHQNFDYELCQRPAKDAIRAYHKAFQHFFGESCLFDYPPSPYNK